MKKIRLGSATGWARDRFEPALDLVLRGNLDYLCFDSMSEVTMSAVQVQRMESPKQIGRTINQDQTRVGHGGGSLKSGAHRSA